MFRITYLLITFLYSSSLFACTTFVIQNKEELVFGRNLDWVSDNGLLIVNKRGVLKKSLVFSPETSVSWTSKYASITFNQFGKEFPFGGMNEKGLVIEIMLADAAYPEFDHRPAVNELQWIQYQLDNSSTIEEVIHNDKKIRISKIKQNLHFLICDKEGNVAALEYKNNELVVYKGADLPVPVLANDAYPESLQKYADNEKCRFTTASRMIKQYPEATKKDIINHSFDILNRVALDGSWRIVYDIKNMEIHFRTASNKSIRKISFGDFDLGCGTVARCYPLRNRDAGNIGKYCQEFDLKTNTAILKDAIATNQIELPYPILEQFYQYNSSCTCALE